MSGTLRAAPLVTPRLRLEPLGVHHAAEMVTVLAGTAIYRFMGGRAPSVAELAERYAAQCIGSSPDGQEAWLNWIIRDITGRQPGTAVGFVQATVPASIPRPTADVAWVVGEAFQGRGIATEAAGAMLGWLRSRTRGRFSACIHPDNTGSAAVARKLGLTGTGQLDEDGDQIWQERVPEDCPPAPAP